MWTQAVTVVRVLQIESPNFVAFRVTGWRVKRAFESGVRILIKDTWSLQNRNGYRKITSPAMSKESSFVSLHTEAQITGIVASRERRENQSEYKARTGSKERYTFGSQFSNRIQASARSASRKWPGGAGGWGTWPRLPREKNVKEMYEATNTTLMNVSNNSQLASRYSTFHTYIHPTSSSPPSKRRPVHVKADALSVRSPSEGLCVLLLVEQGPLRGLSPDCNWLGIVLLILPKERLIAHVRWCSSIEPWGLLKGNCQGRQDPSVPSHLFVLTIQSM